MDPLNLQSLLGSNKLTLSQSILHGRGNATERHPTLTHSVHAGNLQSKSKQKIMHFQKYDALATALRVRQKESGKLAQEGNVATGPIGEVVGTMCQQRLLNEGTGISHSMPEVLVEPEIHACLLQECIRKKSLEEGKSVHGYMIKAGFERDRFLGNNLVNMYVKCGSTEDARQVFDKMSERDVVSWTSIMAGYAQHCNVKRAFRLFDEMKLAGVKPDFIVLGCLLRACSRPEGVEQGKQVHAFIVKSGFETDASVENALVVMYTQCSSLEDACQSFDRMSKSSIASWNAIIAGHIENGRGGEALNWFTRMQRAGIKPNHMTLASILSEFATPGCLKHVKQIHAYSVRTGFDSDAFVQSVLVDIYAKCGSIDDAFELFRSMPERDLVSWTAIIAGYAQHGRGNEALNLFEQMEQAGMKPDHIAFSCILSACARPETLEQGKQVHSHIIKSGYESDVSVGNALVSMYAKCQSTEEACIVFDEMPKRNVVSWTAMISGYAQNGHGEEALNLMCQMLWEDVMPNHITIASVLNACANAEALEQGKQVHAHSIKTGYDWDVFVRNSQITMYARCGKTHDALQVFDKMPIRDLVSWNSMIAGYAENGHGDDVFKLFFKMQQIGMGVDKFTFICLLLVCACPSALSQGKQVHALIIKTAFGWDVCVANALATMYAQSRSIDNARLVFDTMLKQDVVSWNAMIVGYSQNGYGEEVLKLFQQMQALGREPDLVALASVSKACGSLGALKQGKQVHAHVIKTEFEFDVFGQSALLDMYAKCRRIDHALKVFGRTLKPDVVSWTAMIAGYTENGHDEDALKLFCQIQQAGLNPNQFTYTNVLNAIASLATMEHGKQAHACIIKSGFEGDIFVGNALVTMYSKCGDIENAREVFDNILEKDVISWTAMIAGYAHHGYGKVSLELFEQMQREGMTPDHITLTAVLSACSHAGLVGKGCHYFNSISQNYGIKPTIEHYACMVDILGRAGQLDEAWEFINKMPFEPGALVWGTFLGACRIHGNVEHAKHAVERLLELDSQDSSTYVLMSNIYAAAGRWDDVAKVRNMMKGRGVKKDPGCSWIEVNKRVHAFVVGDRSHPETDKIYGKLESLTKQMKEAGYMPNTNCVLYDVEENRKKHFFAPWQEVGHSFQANLQSFRNTYPNNKKPLHVC